MKPLFLKQAFVIAALSTLVLTANAQDYWVSYSKSVSTKEYQGKRFKLQAMVRTELSDDSASARLLARVDKETGTGFFDNMWEKPIRGSQWKNYTL